IISTEIGIVVGGLEGGDLKFAHLMGIFCVKIIDIGLRKKWGFSKNCIESNYGGVKMDLVIKDLNKSFNDKQVLKGINLKIKSGQIFGYLGRNGAGKTTSMRILMDVFKADSGSIT